MADEAKRTACAELPKFKAGQVVAMKSLRKQLPFRILEVVRNDFGWFYRWDRKNCAAEHMCRELTAEEKGEAVNSHDALKKIAADMAEALKILRRALADDGDGSYWPARQYLDKRDIYNGDLNDLRVLHAVTKAALTEYEKEFK